MARRREIAKRKLNPDPKYHDILVARFVNHLMQRGKKTTAEAIFYGSMERVAALTKSDPIKVFRQALENAKPRVEVKSRRVGGSTYQVPVEVPADRALSLAIRWLISYSRTRGEKSMMDKLANEFVDASANRGTTIKKREDTHRMAEANKAFAHYRW
ncbi:MAG: 30S ribosomal protein S7 [Deltaproteobacteria bacterium]|nr:30S ribosomal protein S7 [Deltaproteobacteria bacterium]